MQDIAPGDADRWRIYLIEQKLGDNTVRRRSGIAKQYFKAAIREKLIESNPFEDLVASVQGNASRSHFIDRETTEKVLEACPNAEWRLIFALSRYGGLRCPSEHLGLTWDDVDWDQGRLTIHSPKTEHHSGRESRQIPLFPELRPHLEAVFDQAEEGSTHVITQYRRSNVNLRTQLLKILRRAGVDQWPKLFHNLRASRQTELVETFPSHVVCAWIGNSEAVAKKHYLQVTDENFEKALQNALQYPSETASKEVQEKNGSEQKARNYPGLPLDSASYTSLEKTGVGDTGLEPVTPSLSS